MAASSIDLYSCLFSSNPPTGQSFTTHYPCRIVSPPSAIAAAKRSSTTRASKFSLSTSKKQLPPKGPLSTATKRESHILKLLKRSCKAGKYDEGLYFLECMISKGYKPGAIHCTKLIKGFIISNPKSIAKAERVIEIMEQNGIPDTFSYNALIVGYSKVANQIDTAITVLDRMKSHGCSPDIVTCNILIGALCARGKLARAMELLDRLLLETNCQPTVITYTTLVEASIVEGGIGEAINLLEQMSSKGLGPDSYTYNAILRGMCRQGLVDGAWELVRSLALTAGCESDVISCNILLRGLLSLKRWGDAEKLMAEMNSRDRHRPNVITYSMLISSLCQEGLVDKAVHVLKDMMDAGLKPDTYSYDPLISAYCKQGRMDLAIKFMEYMISNGCVPDIVNYNNILASLCKNGNIEQAIHVFRSLDDMGCPPNTSSYNAIIGGLWNNADRSQALGLVSTMLEKGVEPDEVTYNVLISCLCRDGMVDEALHLMSDMKTGGFQPTMITYNTLILGMCKVQRVDVAIDIFAEMVDRKCRPSENTYIILVEGIAYAGHGAEAAKLGNALLSWNAISTDSIKRMKKTFPVPAFTQYSPLSVKKSCRG